MIASLLSLLLICLLPNLCFQCYLLPPSGYKQEVSSINVPSKKSEKQVYCAHSRASSSAAGTVGHPGSLATDDCWQIQLWPRQEQSQSGPLIYLHFYLVPFQMGIM